MFNYHQILKKAGIRLTKHRASILKCVYEASAPLRHQDLIERASALKVDRVTLYRILSLFADANLIHRVQGTDGAWRYCAHDPYAENCPGGHPHFFCESCASMLCLRDQALPRVNVDQGYEVYNKQMILHGRCASCSANKTQKEKK